MTRTCGERLVALLEQYGVDTVFGIPGVHTLELYRGLSASSIRHVTPRHEQGAAFAADGWARATGQPGVCILISGPGLTNAATAIAQAYHDSQPMLVISAVIASDELGRSYGSLHELPDQRRLMSEITAFSRTVRTPAELPGVLAGAWDLFRSGRPRPVHVEIPVDVLSLPTDELERIPSAAERPCPPAERVNTAAALLARAREPFFVLGGGAMDAGAEVAALADDAGARIALTTNGKGAVPESHPRCVGATLGFCPVAEELERADLVILIGAQLAAEEAWALERPLRLAGALVRIDIDPEQLHRRFPAAVALHGDARESIRALHAAYAATADGVARRPASPGRPPAIAWPERFDRLAAIVDALDQALPDDRLVVADSTQLAYAANHMLPIDRPRSWQAPVGYGTLGCALPMAIGAKLAQPDRPVTCIAGDGGFLFTVAELATAADLGMSLPIVLWNNAGYGEISDSMEAVGIPPIGVAATAHDFVQIAEGFGCVGRRAHLLADIGPLIAEALETDRPTVIELTPAIS